ncbi:MAG: DUF2914 domain-containing protein [Calditrichaeota bacterium]|nr:MAG: DUF2914 domain-containing protein [Calditrichota bacterium]
MKHHFSLAWLLLLILGCAINLLAQEEAATVAVERIAIAKAIVDREPVESGDSFSTETATLFCFTHITGVEGETTITHRWFYNDSLTWDVKLPVRSKSWRTFSSKNFVDEWVGEWKVIILDEAGNELTQKSFMRTEDAN